MPWNTTTPILIWAILCIPIFILLWIFPPKVKLTAILVVIAFLSANFYFAFAVNWSVINYWMRVIPAVLALLLAVRFWRANQPSFDFEVNQIVKTSFLPAKKALPLAALGVTLFVLLVSSVWDYLLIRSLDYKHTLQKPVMLFYPVRYGLYVVTNGGNSLKGLGMNDVYRDWLGRRTGEGDYMAYAVDIMKLRNDRGWVSEGILPTAMPKYDSFRDQVYSPCVGTVVYVENGHKDVAQGTPETTLGNRVVLRCFEFFVTLANLRNDSILVKEGEQVNFNVQIGVVGSSGYPSVPHLRIFTTTGNWDHTGAPVPQQFDLGQRFLVRNDLFLPNY